MSGEFEKYAVYWVPKGADALARFGVSWTGWCAERGEHRPRGEFPGVSLDIPAITRQVWRNGFHAVIQAPFSLQAGRGRFSVEHTLGQVIEESVDLQLPHLRLAVIGGSVAALVPRHDCAALGALVARIGAAMAPLEAADPANGFAEAPTPAQDGIAAGSIGKGIDSLVQLPVTDTHRFHIPLTDRLPLEIAFRVMEELQPLLERLGIEAAPMGPDTIAVHAFTSLLFHRGVDPVDFMTDLLDKAAQEGMKTTDEAALHEVLDMMACKAAVKAGDPLTPEEIDALFQKKELIDKSSSCPHGRPTMLKLTRADLDRQFHRT